QPTPPPGTSMVRWQQRLATAGVQKRVEFLDVVADLLPLVETRLLQKAFDCREQLTDPRQEGNEFRPPGVTLKRLLQRTDGIVERDKARAAVSCPNLLKLLLERFD